MFHKSPPKQLLYIDEHPVCQHGLESMLKDDPQWEVCRRASSENRRELPKSIDLAIVEITSSRPQGIAVVKELRSVYPQTPILVLSSYDETIYADRCLKSGAQGYAMKSSSMQELKRAIDLVSQGELYVSEKVKSLMIDRLANPSGPEAKPTFQNLSDRELLIVEQIGLSKNNKEIAQALQISVKTIESHRSRIKAKLQLDSPQELMRYAMRLHYF
ncbi:LuxR C-terminal-related transcriptional regulator [Pelagicoccus albus]|uniref:Response regulator transcription factor n=1 Tax=Pelagicoccus albus TaxID=415222 RepID=A0A7X1E9F3_9BACT|nr:response regulator transcription factor [Pelagicoccus albus]MBC2607790.1 response regulator transcription factor [Pelagicoccus albus]